ncbi:hypothetical protein [Planotetraspora kaengkrachanensis]|uniref:Uncharacterized protein n=1 Tax=Planotetraspora kaengkrachanensis TaxID=575193 RepID=A0A8J3LX67_9ACTN|nr:hypothetical protein [Planotetraspora kaengkrachanensis]GIG79499.1 hypothetical protein Pka01_26260 [Planotetraspora kaengkrachanensis]
MSRVASWLGLVGHLGTLPFYLASGLVAPLWAIIVLLVAWAVLFGLAVRAVYRRSAWGLAVPFAATGIWLGGMSAGEAFLGWTP